MGDVDALIGYYCRERLYHHAQSVCDDLASRKGWDGKLLFWKCFAMGMEGNVNAALRELEGLLRKRDLELAATEALLFFHRGVKLRDDAAISELERQRGDFTDRASDTSLLTAAGFLLQAGEPSKGKRLCEKVLDKNPMNVKACTLRGWIELAIAAQEKNSGSSASSSSRRESSSGKSGSAAAQFFEQALNADRSGQKELSAQMGMAACLSANGQHAEALEFLDQVVVAQQTFMPALVEKAKALMLMSKWELAFETAERVLHSNSNDIGALRCVALFRLAQDVATDERAEAVQAVCDALERFEPENPALWVATMRPFARLAERDVDLLRRTSRLVEKAKRKAPEQGEFATEHAYQLALQGQFDAAFAAYERAAQLDESNGAALFGQIYCLVRRGELDEASQQLEFLSVLQETIGRTASVAFLEAKLRWQKDGDRRGALKLLNETVHLHVKAIQARRHADIGEHYVCFNPDFMLEIAHEYLQHCGSEPIEVTEAAPQHLVNGIKLLEKVVKFVPCMLSAQIALARAKFVANKAESCAKIVNGILSMDPGSSEAHLMLARVFAHSEDYSNAQASLEQALSSDFQVRNTPTYMIVKARVLLATGDLDEAQSLLEGALKLSGVVLRSESYALDAILAKQSSFSSKDGGAETKGRRRDSSSSSINSGKAVAISEQERVSIFVDLASVYIALKAMDKARGIIKIARREFKGTCEEVRVIVADAELALKRNDVKGALRMLNEVPVDSPAFSRAHLAKANIYLGQNNKDAFIRCYMELVENSPSAHSHLLLGEAYMRVGQPDEAIEAFKEALKRNPKDSALAKRIGKVLVSMHDYSRAIEYYKSALRGADSGAGKQELRFDLAELYYNLGKLAKAEKELQSSLNDFDADQEDESKGADIGERRSAKNMAASIAEISSQVKALKLLAKVYEGYSAADSSGGAAEDERTSASKVLDTLERARTAQGRVLALMRGAVNTEASQAAKLEMAQICILIADYHELKEHNPDEAVSMYNEALRHDSGHVPSMLQLAKLHLRSGDLERCHNQCVTILRVDEHNEEASMMLADLMFQRNEFKVAIRHYQQLLDHSPTNFGALSRLVTLLYRAGELQQAEHYFQLSIHKAPRVVHDPGFCYCKGLFFRYGSDVNNAVSQFNMARRDVVWGERALTQMIKIYLNPDNTNLWEDAGDSGAVPIADQGNNNNSVYMAQESVRTAKSLLEELPDKQSLNYRILDAYANMASKNRPDIEKAFQKLVEIVQENPDHVPSLLALSTSLMLLKQVPKARNQLKRISKMNYDQEQADSFEQCWLLLTDIFISSGKYDLAQGLCKRCLQYNRSCSKAWEYMGAIMEKEAAYADAADHYEQAWHFQKMNSASVGYKLAFNYLKAKRNVEAIDVATKVLKQYPDYPKIRKDILDKARASIRL